MRHVLALLLLALNSFFVAAAEEPAQIMLMGTFHFTSPKLDSVKVDNIDVTTPQSQVLLERMTKTIADSLKPTQVMLEYDKKYDQRINERYQQYLDGEFTLPVNEIYQLGFRVAKQAGVTSIKTFDHREVSWLAGPMNEYAKVHEPEAFSAYEKRIEDFTKAMQHQQNTLSLLELLIKQNEQSEFDANKALYIATNSIGADSNFTGADASASWWHRNFRMYSLVQRVATPGERVFVLGGSGHIAIIQDLLHLDNERSSAAVLPLLKKLHAEANSNR